MIRSPEPGDPPLVLAPASAPGTPPGEPPSGANVGAGEAGARLDAAVRAQVGFVWRSLRRLGLSPADADDATQRVMLVFAAKFGAVTRGSERAFLSSTLTRIASRWHRTARRRPQAEAVDVELQPHLAPGPERLLEQRRARAELDALLAQMPFELRAAFVLFELEGCTQPEIAAALGLPRGTVASRLRRAREDFERRARRAGLLDETGAKR